jgi:hypothetical protein
MAALAITTQQAFRNRLNGEVFNNPAETEKIEAIFREFNVIDVWGKV